jgi:cytochrome P450
MAADVPPSPAHTPAALHVVSPHKPPPVGRAGRLNRLRRQLAFVVDPLGTVARRFAHFGDAYRVHQPSSELFAFRHPDHIKDVLVTNAADFDKQHSAFKTLSTLLGDALLTSDGERWRRQRRLVQPAFAKSRLQQYSEVMVEEAAVAAERLAQQPRKLDLSHELNALTLRIVTRTLFGQAAADPARTGAAMQDINQWFSMPPQFMELWPGARRRFERARRSLYADIDGIIATQQRVPAHVQDGRTLLSALLSARDDDDAALSAHELRDQLLTLYLAGHETTSRALTWTFYLLSRHPEVLARLRAEYARVLGGRTPHFDDLPALSYTEQVLKEALRLYPPAFVLPRHVDTTVGPYHVPKDSEIVVWTYMTHRDPRFYREPLRFIPERFSGEEDKLRHKYAYLPFGHGQRACIGQAFAMLEAQLILATWVPRLYFKYARLGAAKPRIGVTLAPRGGLPVRISGRS